MEQRCNVKFCARLGKSPTETSELLREVYGDEAFSRPAVKQLYLQFGNPANEDDEQTARIRELLKREPSITMELLEEMTGASSSRVYKICTESLRLRQISSRLVPRILSESEKRARLVFARDMTTTVGSEPLFLESLVTGGLTWCFEREPRQLADGPELKKVRLQNKSRLRTRLIVFFDAVGMIYREFVPEGQSLDAEYHYGLARRLCEKIQSVRPQYKRPGTWTLLYDDASYAHKCITVRNYFARKVVPQLELPAHSPDLTPCDYFLFPKMRQAMPTDERFENLADIQAAVTDALASIPEEDFQRAFQKMIDRCTNCLAADGMYFGK